MIHDSKRLGSFTFSRISVHPLFVQSTDRKWDVAIVGFEEELSWPDGIRISEALLHEGPISFNLPLLVAGYGCTNISESSTGEITYGGPSLQARSTSVSLLNWSNFLSVIDYFKVDLTNVMRSLSITESRLNGFEVLVAPGLAQGARGQICVGDSGGPVFLNDAGFYSNTLVGLSSAFYPNSRVKPIFQSFVSIPWVREYIEGSL